ncbi:exosortase B [Duganella sp. P38]|uniref:exosortase B n=1 Tax=Duganella sp. P38 TaxID=3423949 RepID=UPI003D7B6E9A
MLETNLRAALTPQALARWRPWVPMLLGLCVLYVPSFVDLFSGIWATDAQAHGPLVLALSLWLIYRKWPAMMAAPSRPAPVLGWGMLAIGLLSYMLGRSQELLLLEIGSLLWVLVGLLLLHRGGGAFKEGWFGFFFMMFMVPLPSPIVDALTQPIQLLVSTVAEQILYTVGYPVARSGVILQIGQYQLLVAEACAGLHTLFTLEALGLLYMNLVRHQSLVRNVVLSLLIIPISFTANVIRVMTLTLITYYFGDAAGQGFLHGFSGMVLFLSALALIIGLDSLLKLRFGGGGEPAARVPTLAKEPQP